jgi:hypothetical protein
MKPNLIKFLFYDLLYIIKSTILDILLLNITIMSVSLKLFFLSSLLSIHAVFSQNNIPLPEHPRPDFERNQWQNLNGYWDFEFDKSEVGLIEKWEKGSKQFSSKILVPFPWGAPLSEVKDEADVAYYSKNIIINPDWKGQRVFVNIGASDWHTTVYIDGEKIGEHKGGYTPFSFEVKNPKFGKPQRLVIRADDKRRDFALYGKQGYGNARGIWQTVYIEARGQAYIDALHFTPDIDKNEVIVKVLLSEKLAKNTDFSIIINAEPKITRTIKLEAGIYEKSITIPIPNALLWDLDHPHLYDVSATLGTDKVKSYFGMRKISTMNLPNTNYKYIAINNKPVYMQLTLDQSYHPTGFYTFPSDDFMKNEIVLAKKIGLNGIRTHIKIDIPRKLYWADKLGLLVMSDLPNFWGEPTQLAKAESEATIKEMIKRDYNHPSIFSWIAFNETWGLISKQELNGVANSSYLPETQQWVKSIYRMAKSLDATRLVEDNSICCGAGHTETDINSWHEYLPGVGWEKHLKEIDSKTFIGSSFHYEKGYLQSDVPNINSECGNVWGYEGSTGDCDYSWDYHRMINSFRKYPKIAGWLYTEHHDVINEWNGYYRFDRSEKETGFSDIAKGMSLNDLHSDIFISAGNEISRSVRPNEQINMPLFLSAMTDKNFGKELNLKIQLTGYDAIGQEKDFGSQTLKIPYTPWTQKDLGSVMIKMPNEKAVVIVALILEDSNRKVLNRNFTTYIVEADVPSEIVTQNGKKVQLVSFEPKDFVKAAWSEKQWNVLENAKVNGAGAGYFEYKIKLPSNIKLNEITNVDFVAELSAKQLFVKDMNKKLKGDEDYMLGAKAEPSQNPNAYPMTDQTRYPSEVLFTFNGIEGGKKQLPNDPADSRGILSWHYQLGDRKLREAGSYGYLTKVNLPQAAIDIARKTGEIVIRMQVSDHLPGGLAIYSDRFGRYPVNPTLIVE